MDKHLSICCLQVKDNFGVGSESKFSFSRQLGFQSGTVTTKSHFGSVNSTFAMDNVACNSTHETIQDCSYVDETTEDCGPDQGAGVKCFANNGEQ